MIDFRKQRETAIEMLKQRGGTKRITVGADRGYDTQGFVEQLRALDITPTLRRTTQTGAARSMSER